MDLFHEWSVVIFGVMYNVCVVLCTPLIYKFFNVFQMIMQITIQPKLLSHGHILVHVPTLNIIIHARHRVLL